MTDQPDPVVALDGLALAWCALRQDSEGTAVILAAADLAQVSRFLAWGLASHMVMEHGHDQADRIIASTRRVFLDAERQRQQPPDDGPDPIWPD